MTTLTETITPQTRSLSVFHRRFFIGMAAASALIVFLGFARTYYLKNIFPTPSLPILFHVHGGRLQTSLSGHRRAG